MPAPIKFENPIRLGKLTKILEIRGAGTYFHWTVFAVSAFILAGVAANPGLSLLGLTCYFGVLLIHEAGHLVAAQRKGCRVQSIEIYPFFGITRFENLAVAIFNLLPFAPLDGAIAWRIFPELLAKRKRNIPRRP